MTIPGQIIFLLTLTLKLIAIYKIGSSLNTCNVGVGGMVVLNRYLYSIPLLNKKPTKKVVNCHPFCSNTFPLLYSFPKMLKHLPTRIRLVSPSPPQIY